MSYLLLDREINSKDSAFSEVWLIGDQFINFEINFGYCLEEFRKKIVSLF